MRVKSFKTRCYKLPIINQFFDQVSGSIRQKTDESPFLTDIDTDVKDRARVDDKKFVDSASFEFVYVFLADRSKKLGFNQKIHFIHVQ